MPGGGEVEQQADPGYSSGSGRAGTRFGADDSGHTVVASTPTNAHVDIERFTKLQEAPT